MPLSRFLPADLVGVLTTLLMVVCISTWFVIMLPFIVLRLVPVYRVQRVASGICVQIATWWVGSNKAIYRLTHGEQGKVIIEGDFAPNRSYLVVSNHAAWADIQILFDVLHGHAPFGRFFLKQELIWVPIIGVVCWAMDFPFMKRHSREKLARNPALAQQDLETTRQACEVYKKQPVTVINFLEGTRFTEAKKIRKKSLYNNLLNPKYGGLSVALNAMGEQFAGLVDVTIVYEPVKGNVTWSWLCGQQKNMHIRIQVLPIPAEMIGGDYRTDPEFKAVFKSWIGQLWSNKDAEITRVKQDFAAAPPKDLPFKSRRSS